MNILGRRVEVERLLALTSGPAPDLEKRRAIWFALDAAALEGGREMTFIAAAAVLLAGGQLRIEPATLAAIPTSGALFITVDADTSAITVTTEHDVASQLLDAMAQAGGAQAGQPVEAPQPEPEGDTFPAADPDELPNHAVIRICNAVRLLLQRRYDGEIRARGFQFLPAVFGELLAMAIGIELANRQEPETIVQRLAQLTQHLEGRVLHYQLVTEQTIAATEAESGEPSPSTPSRVM